MNNNITFYGGGVKCDNPHCDYVEQSVKIEDYKNWVNKPCPKCGANLLTEADYKNVQLILRIVNFLNKIGNIINKIPPRKKVPSENERATLTFQMDGSGKIDMEINETEC